MIPTRLIGQAPRRERGVVLFIALIVLVAMSLAAIALTRAVDTNTLIAGNLAFKQSALNAGDAAVDDARNWLVFGGVSGGALEQDNAGGKVGYYASWQDSFNVGTYEWDDPTKATTMGVDAAGNTVQYVIHRLCRTAGNVRDANVDCLKFEAPGVAGTEGSSKGAAVYGGLPLGGALIIYYRVTARVLGPRNTVSYVQAVMY